MFRKVDRIYSSLGIKFEDTNDIYRHLEVLVFNGVLSKKELEALEFEVCNKKDYHNA